MSRNPFHQMMQNQQEKGEEYHGEYTTPSPQPDPEQDWVAGFRDLSVQPAHAGPSSAPSHLPTYDEITTGKEALPDFVDTKDRVSVPRQPSPPTNSYGAFRDAPSIQQPSGSGLKPPQGTLDFHPRYSDGPPMPSSHSRSPSGSRLPPGQYLPPPLPQLNHSRSMPSLGTGGPTEPPAGFSRPPPPNFPYTPFPTLCLLANDKHLDKGFPLMPPPSASQPHPFATHDVTKEDWTRFLDDMQRTAKLSGGQRLAAAVLPVTMNLGFAGFFVSKAIENGMKDKKQEPVGQLVDVWNHNFFHPRRVEVILAQGSVRHSGGPSAPIAWEQEVQRLAHHRSRSASSSSDSSSSGRYGHIGDIRAGRARKDALREIRDARKGERRARRDARRGRRDERRGRGGDQVWRLFVVPL